MSCVLIQFLFQVGTNPLPCQWKAAIDNLTAAEESINVVKPAQSSVYLPANPTLRQGFLRNSPLLICSSCCVCVHAVCYGVNMDGTQPPSNWVCDRCANSVMSVVSISLSFWL